jgi:hypothetical protein
MYYRGLGDTLFVLLIISGILYNYLISLYHRDILLFFVISLIVLAIAFLLIAAFIINYRQKKGFYKSSFWINLARGIRLRDDYTCQKCGLHGWHVHHKVPKGMGGSDDPSNLETLCEKCHRSQPFHEKMN